MMKKILFIGFGKMGTSLAKNLIKNGLDSSDISAIDPNHNTKIDAINYHQNQNQLAQNQVFDVIFLCTKPQESQEVLINFAKTNNFSNNTIFVSIIAGKKLRFFRNIFGKKAKIIRTMPNLPVIENQGVFAYIFNQNLNNEDKKNIVEIFENFGEIIELEDERNFDDFTAIFGSGPAYIFYLQEIFENFTKSFIKDEKKSAKMVEKLFFGSALMSKNSNFTFSQLKQSVTSKEGTTDAALQVLEKNNKLEKILQKAINSAIKRSKELSK